MIVKNRIKELGAYFLFYLCNPLECCEIVAVFENNDTFA